MENKYLCVKLLVLSMINSFGIGLFVLFAIIGLFANKTALVMILILDCIMTCLYGFFTLKSNKNLLR